MMQNWFSYKGCSKNAEYIDCAARISEGKIVCRASAMEINIFCTSSLMKEIYIHAVFHVSTRVIAPTVYTARQIIGPERNHAFLAQFSPSRQTVKLNNARAERSWLVHKFLDWVNPVTLLESRKVDYATRLVSRFSRNSKMYQATPKLLLYSRKTLRTCDPFGECIQYLGEQHIEVKNQEIILHSTEFGTHRTYLGLKRR